MEMKLLVVQGNTFPLRAELSEVMEWDGDHGIYAMFVHEGNADDVQQIMNVVRNLADVSHQILPEQEYRNLFPTQPKGSARKQGNGGGAGKPSANGAVAGQFAQMKQKSAAETFAEENKDVVQWLTNYRGTFDFYLSVKSQLEKKGTLSPKQVEAIKRAIARDAAKAAPAPQAAPVQAPAPVAKFDQARATYKPGTVLQLKKWIAGKLQKEIGMSHLFVNVEIVETVQETAKAVQVTIKFSARYSTCCSCCGRKLDNQVSRATGIGPICADRMGIGQYSLENAQAVLRELESKLDQIGQKTVWIPRSQVKQVVS